MSEAELAKISGIVDFTTTRMFQMGIVANHEDIIFRATGKFTASNGNKTIKYWGSASGALETTTNKHQLNFSAGSSQKIPYNDKTDPGIPWNYQNLFVYRRTS